MDKNVLEVITELPNYKWKLKQGLVWDRVKIDQLIFVYYEWKKPRNEEDLYQHLEVNKGITLEHLDFIKNETERGMGLTSMVVLKNPEDHIGQRFAHIPFIDFDIGNNIDSLNDNDLLSLIKNKIYKETEIEKGLILKSSSKRNYHFIGTDRLFLEEDFITFIGLCLGMKYKINDEKQFVLADSKHLGHALSPMKYLAELNQQNFSKYDIQTRFSTLRLNPKKSNENYPVVIDIME